MSIQNALGSNQENVDMLHVLLRQAIDNNAQVYGLFVAVSVFGNSESCHFDTSVSLNSVLIIRLNYYHSVPYAACIITVILAS